MNIHEFCDSFAYTLNKIQNTVACLLMIPNMNLDVVGKGPSNLRLIRGRQSFFFPTPSSDLDILILNTLVVWEWHFWCEWSNMTTYNYRSMFKSKMQNMSLNWNLNPSLNIVILKWNCITQIKTIPSAFLPL